MTYRLLVCESVREGEGGERGGTMRCRRVETGVVGGRKGRGGINRQRFGTTTSQLRTQNGRACGQGSSANLLG